MSADYPAPCGLCGVMLDSWQTTSIHFVQHALEGHPALNRTDVRPEAEAGRDL